MAAGAFPFSITGHKGTFSKSSYQGSKELKVCFLVHMFIECACIKMVPRLLIRQKTWSSGAWPFFTHGFMRIFKKSYLKKQQQTSNIFYALLDRYTCEDFSV